MFPIAMLEYRMVKQASKSPACKIVTLQPSSMFDGDFPAWGGSVSPLGPAKTATFGIAGSTNEEREKLIEFKDMNDR